MSWLPTVGGVAGVILFVVGSIVGLFRWLVQNDISILREQLAEQSQRVAQLEVLYDEQRHEKHMYINKYARSQILLGVIKTLADQCSCGALENVGELIDRALAEAD